MYILSANDYILKEKLSLNICKFQKKLGISWKTNLIVNLNVVKNIWKLKKINKQINTKGGSQCLYAPVILIDSIYGKDENYYPKVFLEKYYFTLKCFLKNIILLKT